MRENKQNLNNFVCEQNYKEKEENKESSDNPIDKSFFCADEVENGCSNPLKIIFQTLLLEKKVKQQDLADFLCVDKAYVSRVVNGIYIPDLNMRLKIASYFGVDSCLIWRFQDLKYIRKLIKKQEVQNAN